MKWVIIDDMFCVDNIKERNRISNLGNAFLLAEIVSPKIEERPHGSITMPDIMMPLTMAYSNTEKLITTDTPQVTRTLIGWIGH